jgi:O-antigen/teichoic acid export membrane protein
MPGHNKRIIKNTIMLYFREILLLLVTLYTIRVVLNALGVVDYGIYSVIGGIVSLFSFLSGTMSSATQRFFSYSLGRNDFIKLKHIFSVNLLIYLGIAAIILILSETLGLWFVKGSLKIPAERYEAALFIYQFSVFSFIVNIAYIPFIGMIIAHEDMHIYAYISIVESVLKLCVAFLLILIPQSKLELYSVLIFIVSLINASIYIGICFVKYEECQFRKLYWDKCIFKEIIGFTGWTLFGQLTTVFRNQAVTILLNQVFNPQTR